MFGEYGSWNGFEADGGTYLGIYDSIISNTEGVMVLFSSMSGSTMIIERVTVIDSTGAQVDVSTLKPPDVCASNSLCLFSNFFAIPRVPHLFLLLSKLLQTAL